MCPHSFDGTTPSACRLLLFSSPPRSPLPAANPAAGEPPSTHQVFLCKYAHLLTVPILQELRDEVAAAEAATASASTRRVPLPGENTASNEGGGGSQMGYVAAKKRRGQGQLPIDKSFNLGLCTQMDALIARAFYTTGQEEEFA